MLSLVVFQGAMFCRCPQLLSMVDRAGPTAGSAKAHSAEGLNQYGTLFMFELDLVVAIVAAQVFGGLRQTLALEELSSRVLSA